MSSTKLKNAPLKEVIFELHWEGETNENGVLVDSGYDLAQGLFWSAVKDNYPIKKRLYLEGSPFKIYGMPEHQYWTDQQEWPVVQHGPGTLAVNEVEKGYEWQNKYKNKVIDAVEAMIKSYEKELKIKLIKLQYIDQAETKDTFDFLNNNLQTKIDTKYNLPGEKEFYNIVQTSKLEDGSYMILNIKNGIDFANNTNIITWTNTIQKNNVVCNEIETWLENAHKVASDFFKNMLNNDYYDSLDN